MPFALKLVFSRELSLQFSDGISSGPDSTAKRRTRDARHLGEQMHVLGSMDYLKVSALGSLSSVLSNCQTVDNAIARGPSLGGVSELVLVPAINNGQAIDLSVERFGDCSLAYMIRISMSSVVFDRMDRWDGATKAIDDAVLYIDRELKFGCHEFSSIFGNVQAEVCESMFKDMNWTSWRTLGGPDIVCLAFPESAEHIGLLIALTSFLRSRMAIDMIDEEKVLSPLEGHAFSSVQGNLIFRDTEKAQPALRIAEKPIFRETEELLGICYPSRFSVGPGHEREVLERIREELSQKGRTLDEGSSVICIGHRSISIRFNHLEDAIIGITAACRPRTNEADAWTRKGDVSATRTTVAFRYEQKQDPGHVSHDVDRIPDLSDELTNRLTMIEKRFDRFSKRYLGPSQQNELELLLQSLQAAFRRNERATGVRDLLPFFEQLSRCMEEDKKWDMLINDFGDEIYGQFSVLFRHVWRSIRNRIEYRSEPVDPAFPSTIAYGASKLVNAYTAAAWAASLVLLHDPNRPSSNDIKNSDCPSEYFAAAVCTGTEGAVAITNVFAGLLEDDEEPLAMREAGKERWNAPLILLSISGPALFNPEIAFALCFHEVGELSGWMEAEHTKNIRRAVNEAAFDFFHELVARRLRLDDLGFTCDDYSEEIRNYAILALVLKLPQKKQSSALLGTEKTVEDTEHELQESLSPSRYVHSLTSRLDKLEEIHLRRAEAIVHGIEKASDADLSRNALPQWLYGLLNYPKGKDRKHFHKRLTAYERHINEYLADLAMSLSLRRILGLASGTDMIRHLVYFYTHLIRFTLEMKPSQRDTVIYTMLMRLRFQVACHSIANDPNSTAKNVKTALRDLGSAFAKPNGESPPLIRDDEITRFSEGDYSNEWSMASVTSSICDDSSACDNSLANKVASVLSEKTEVWDLSHDLALNDITESFGNLWQDAVSDEEMASLDQRRYDFILKMWAKAQKFRVSSAFGS